MDETPTYIMDSNDWLEFLDTMNNREIAKLARDLARNPTPTEPEMDEIYQLYEIEAEERRALDHSSDEEEEDEEDAAPGPASRSRSSYEATDAPAVTQNEDAEDNEDALQEKHALHIRASYPKRNVR